MRYVAILGLALVAGEMFRRQAYHAGVLDARTELAADIGRIVHMQDAGCFDGLPELMIRAYDPVNDRFALAPTVRTATIL